MSLISKEHLSLTLQSIKKLLSRKADKSELQEEISKVSSKIANSDWSQNDESALDYVKNRTHWEEENIIDIEGLTYNIVRFGIVASGFGESAVFYPHGSNIPLALGQTWFIDANIYKCTCEVRQADDGTLYLGYHPDKLGGQPFCITSTDAWISKNWNDYKHVNSFVVTGVSGTYTDEPIIHHLEPKYIKDMYYTETKTLSETREFSVPFINDSAFAKLLCEHRQNAIYTAGGTNFVYVSDLQTSPDAFEWTVTNGVDNIKIIVYGSSQIVFSPNASITINYEVEEVHKISEKYIPDSIARVDDVDTVMDVAVEFINRAVTGKMDENNPVGTGSFSMNRKSDTIIGSYSYAEGYYTTASNTASHAEGVGSVASGNSSHAEGSYTTASGNSSHAEGDNTVASSNHQHVQGKCNIEDTEGKYAHIVGNGTTDTERSNANTLDWNGVGWFQGGLQVGGNAQDDGAKNVLLEGDAIPVPKSASIGQTIAVKSVDENGKPVEWETTDISTSGGSGCVVSDTAPEDTSVLWIDTSDNSSDENLGGGNADQSGLVEYHASNNLYDPANLVGTHTINGSSVSGLSNWIPVKAKTKYVSNKTYTQYYLFDAEKNYLSSATHIYAPVVITAPQDGFLLIKTNGDTETVVVEGTDLGNHYEGYHALRESLTRRVSKADNNTWVGKKWLAIGDSLTDPGVASEGYPYLVSKALGLTLTNVGASGKVMNYFVDQIPGYADDFDLVTVLLGTNNQGYNCSVGSLNDGVDYKSNNSFYAQTQKLAEVLMAKYPAAVIAFMTPIRRCDYGDNPQNNNEGYYINALGLTTEPYAEAVKEVADYYGLPCLDLYHNGINPKSEWMRQLYFVNSDGTHPNNDGHAKYTAPVIKSFLESLAPFVERVVVEPDIPEPDNPGTDDPITAYSVTNMLTNATSSNSTASVNAGASYSATITANDGYELNGVTVTMGGTDISATAVNGSVINIANVTGNIVITATATKTEADNSEPVLVHSYLGTSVPESGILEDQTGSYDLSAVGTSSRFIKYGNNGLGIANGDSVSFKFVNVKRNSVYFDSRGMDTSGEKAWHFNINGNTDLTGRFSIAVNCAPEGNTGVFGKATARIEYANSAGSISTNTTALYGTSTFDNGATYTVTVTYNSADKSVKMYLNGALEVDEIMSVPMQIEGIALTLGDPFERFEVYRGIITDVG